MDNVLLPKGFEYDKIINKIRKTYEANSLDSENSKLIGGIYFKDELASEAYKRTLLKNFDDGFAAFSNGKGSMFIVMHGTKNGYVAFDSKAYKLQHISEILSVDNLIPEDIKNIYTISCYGGLQQPFVMPNGVEVKSSHTSKLPLASNVDKYGDKMFAHIASADNAQVLPEVSKIFANDLFSLQITNEQFKEALSHYKDFLKKEKENVKKYGKNQLFKDWEQLPIYERYHTYDGDYLNYHNERKGQYEKKIKEQEQIESKEENVTIHEEALEEVTENQSVPTENVKNEKLRKHNRSRGPKIKEKVPTDIPNELNVKDVFNNKLKDTQAYISAINIRKKGILKLQDFKKEIISNRGTRVFTNLTDEERKALITQGYIKVKSDFPLPPNKMEYELTDKFIEEFYDDDFVKESYKIYKNKKIKKSKGPKLKEKKSQQDVNNDIDEKPSIKTTKPEPTPVPEKTEPVKTSTPEPKPIPESTPKPKPEPVQKPEPKRKQITEASKKAIEKTTKETGEKVGKNINLKKLGGIGLAIAAVGAVAYGVGKAKENSEEKEKRIRQRYSNEGLDNSYAMQMAQDISSYRYGKHMTGFVNY